MYLASKAGRNYHELLPSLAGQTHPNAAVNMPGTTCVEHHSWDPGLPGYGVQSRLPRLGCWQGAPHCSWQCRCVGVSVQRVAWPCFCSCPYPDRLQLQPSLSSSRVVRADGSVILVWLLLPHPQAVQVIPSPLTLPGSVPAQCCYHATQALDQG